MAFILTVVYALSDKLNNKTCGVSVKNSTQTQAAILLNQQFLKLAMPAESIGSDQNELRSHY
jgi:hypothetical protein